MVNYFEVLNVSENAEPEVIKASYRALCKKYHPDNQSGHSAQDDEKMQLINEAYQVLSDPVKRALLHFLPDRNRCFEEVKPCALR